MILPVFIFSRLCEESVLIIGIMPILNCMSFALSIRASILSHKKKLYFIYSLYEVFILDHNAAAEKNERKDYFEAWNLNWEHCIKCTFHYSAKSHLLKLMGYTYHLNSKAFKNFTLCSPLTHERMF